MSVYLSSSETEVFLTATASMQVRNQRETVLTTPVFVDGETLHPVVGSLNLQCFDKSAFAYRLETMPRDRYRLNIVPTEPATLIGEPVYSPDEHLPNIQDAYPYRGIGYVALCFDVAVGSRGAELTTSGMTDDGTEVLLPNTQSQSHSLLYVAMSQLYYRTRQR